MLGLGQRFFALFVLLALQHGIGIGSAYAGSGFVRTSGARFVIDGGRPFYSNGFNAYWLMYMAADPDPAGRSKVSSALQQASSYDMTVVRTWAFSDAGYRPLQISPGHYNVDMFKVRIHHANMVSLFTSFQMRLKVVTNGLLLH